MAVIIHYSQPGEKPLKVKNNEVIFKFPKNGMLQTSTNYDSVAYLHTTKVFSMNEQGELVKEVVSESEIPPPTVYSFDDHNPEDITYINFDSSEENCREF